MSEGERQVAERFRAWVQNATGEQEATPANGAVFMPAARAVAAALESGQSPIAAAAAMLKVLTDPKWGYERYVRVRDVVSAVEGETAALADRWDLLRTLAQSDPELMKDIEQLPGPGLMGPSQD